MCSSNNFKIKNEQIGYETGRANTNDCELLSRIPSQKT
jgi:hypothetical protein